VCSSDLPKPQNPFYMSENRRVTILHKSTLIRVTMYNLRVAQ